MGDKNKCGCEKCDKCGCGMPLSDETRCKCNPKSCIHCCECPDDCKCGCKEKAKKDKEKDEKEK